MKRAEQLYRISGSEFHEGLFGPEKFSGLSRNGSQAILGTENLKHLTFTTLWVSTPNKAVNLSYVISCDTKT